MNELTGILLAAAAAIGLSRATGLPSIPFLLVAGLLLNALRPVPSTAANEMLLLGLTVLLFAAGAEFGPRRVGRHWRAALRVGLSHFVLLGAVTGGLALLFGWTPRSALYIGTAAAASSTLVVVRLLALRAELAQPMGRLVLGVLLLQDGIVILLIPLLEGTRAGGPPLLVQLGGMVALVALALVCQRLVFPRLVLSLQSEDEGLVLTVLAVLFVFLGLAWLLGVSPVAAAFLAGLSLAEFPVSAIVRGQLGSLWDFFHAVFFTALGTVVEFPGVREMTQGLLLTGVLIVLTPLVVSELAQRAGLSARSSLEAGLLLAQTSELSLVLGLHGLEAGALDPAGFSVLATVTVLTMLLTPLLTLPQVTRKLMYLLPLGRYSLPTLAPGGHLMLLGCGDTGVRLLEHLDPARVVVVDHDPAVVAGLRTRGIASVRGEGVDRRLLESLGIQQARAVVSTLPRTEDNVKLVRMAAPVPVLVRVFDIEPALRIQGEGGHPLLHSEAAAEDFLATLRKERPELRQANHPEGNRHS